MFVVVEVEWVEEFTHSVQWLDGSSMADTSTGNMLVAGREVQ
jgi:hypothetical protein